MTDIKAGEGPFEENTELSFAEMLEESLKSLNTDEKVRGVVVGIAQTKFRLMWAESKQVLYLQVNCLPTQMQNRRTL